MFAFSVGILGILAFLFMMQLPLVMVGETRMDAKVKSVWLGFSFICAVFLFTALGYATRCTRYTDTVRMWTEITDSSTFGTSYLFEKYSINPLSGVLLYLSAQSGNSAALPAIASFLYYGAFFLVVWKLRNRVSAWSLLLGQFYVLIFLDLTYPIDNIRFPVASMIFCTGILMYYCFGWSVIKASLVCIVGCFVHVSLWIFFFAFLVTLYAKKKLVYLISVICLIYYFAIEQLTVVAERVNPVLGWKMQSYFDTGSQYYKSDISIAQTAFCLAGLLVAFGVFYLWEKKCLLNDREIGFFHLALVFGCLILGSLPSNVTFARWVPVLVILSIYPMVQMLDTIRKVASTRSVHGRAFAPLIVLVFLAYLALSLVLRCTNSYEPFYVLI